MFLNPQKSILLLRFLRNSYNSMSWVCPGILKSSCGMDVVSNRWKYIISLFRDYIPIGYRDIQIQNFCNVTSSYLQYWACSQTLACLAAWLLQFVLLCFGSILVHFKSLRILVQPKYLIICFSQLCKFMLWRLQVKKQNNFIFSSLVT